MEKPSSAYASISRYTQRDREDRESADHRYADRMALRGVPVLRDSGEDAEKPVWRGDHTFSSDAATYSLVNFIEPEIAKKHPDWSSESVHAEAMKQFEKRLSQDLTYEQKESFHEESAVTWKPVQAADGTWELATEYGDALVTLSELWNHTREYAEFAGNPAAYNVEEHRAQLAMQDALISGSASGFVSVLSHPDSVRYVQLWQKTDDGSVVSTQIDLLKTTGKDFSHDEGASLIRHLAVFHGADPAPETPVSGYAHFFVREKSVREQDIRTIAVAQVMEAHESRASVFIPKEIAAAGRVIIRDTADSMVQLSGYVWQQIDEKIRFLRSESGMVHEASEKQDERTGRLKFSEEHRVRHTEPEVVRARGRKIGTHGTEYSTDTMKSVAAEWWVTRLIVLRSAFLPVGSVAVMHWFSVSRESARVSVPVRRISAVRPAGEQFGGEHRWSGSALVSVKNWLRRMDIRRTRMPEASESQQGAEAGKRRSIMTEIGKRLRFTSSERKIHAVSERAERFMVHVRRLAAYVSHMPEVSGRNVKSETTGRVIISDIVRNGQETEQMAYAVRRLQFAIMMWWILMLYRQDSVRPQTESPVSPVNERQTDARGETDPQDGVPWILLTVIWQLTAIREQGKSNPQMRKKKKKQTNPVAVSSAGSVTLPSLPPNGIIFAYRS